MIEPVSQERWKEAQAAESRVVSYSLDGAARSYQHIFDYLGMTAVQTSKTIVEIGCGPFPALMFCDGVNGIAYEPLFPKPNHCGSNVVWIRSAFEEFDLNIKAHECWLFNVLQHVRDPELVVLKAKERAPIVRFFEPVDYPTCVYHPHTFTQADFERWFGKTERYTDRVAGFFDADCCYGTWKRP